MVDMHEVYRQNWTKNTLTNANPHIGDAYKELESFDFTVLAKERVMVSARCCVLFSVEGMTREN